MSFLSNFFGDFFQYSFLRWATLSTCLIALGTGALSPLVVGNRLSFMGSAIAHSTLLAVGLAYLMVGTQSWGCSLCHHSRLGGRDGAAAFVVELSAPLALGRRDRNFSCWIFGLRFDRSPKISFGHH